VGRRTAKSTAEFDVNYANGDGDRLARWNVSRTNLAVSVAGYASEPIGTNAQIGMGQVYNSAGSATPTISGTNFTATLQAEALGTQTVVVLISDVAGNVGVTTNRHVLTAYTTGAYSGDAAGCVTQIVYQGPLCEQNRVLAWDAEYRLTSVKTNGATAETHTYDPYGRRISTTDADGAVTRYLNDGAHVLADLDATGGVLRTYFYGPNVDELLAMTVHTGVVAQTYYAIRDHQNTIWAWVNTNGAVVESYDFAAWGRVLAVTDGNGNALGGSAIGNRYLFQGREYSWATGLYYFRARWYDSVTGRWLSTDPIGINGGLNQYVAFGNNPVNFVDPLGLWELSIGVADAFGIQFTIGKNTKTGMWNWQCLFGYGFGAAYKYVPSYFDECHGAGKDLKTTGITVGLGFAASAGVGRSANAGIEGAITTTFDNYDNYAVADKLNLTFGLSMLQGALGGNGSREGNLFSPEVKETGQIGVTPGLGNDLPIGTSRAGAFFIVGPIVGNTWR
jgi:RHS repeat-associated protein